MVDEESFKSQFAAKFKKLLQEKGFGLTYISQCTGISEDLLGKYTKAEVLPALGDLMNLAKVLDVTMGYFFLVESTQSKVEVVRSADRWKREPLTEAATTLNYSYEALSFHMNDKVMFPFFIEIPPSQDRKVSPSSHDGEEFFYILTGQVEVTVGDEKHILNPEDCIYFDSLMKHTIRALGQKKATMISCLINVRRARNEDDPIGRAYGQ